MKALVRVAQWALRWNVSVLYHKLKSNIRNYLFLIFEIGTSVKDCNTKALHNVKSIWHMWRFNEFQVSILNVGKRINLSAKGQLAVFPKQRALVPWLRSHIPVIFVLLRLFSLGIHRLCSYSDLVVVGCCFSKTVVPVEKTSCLVNYFDLLKQRRYNLFFDFRHQLLDNVFCLFYYFWITSNSFLFC